MAKTTPSGLTKYQRFEIATVNRRDIKSAPYNPRTISPENAKRLKRTLKSLGLVEPLVWNKRSGNIVGGHQRIDQLDDLEQRDDYNLTCAVVDVDEKDEKKLNLALNNRNLQGDWDEPRLADLLRDFDKVDFDHVGVTEADRDFLLYDEGGAQDLSGDAPERVEVKDILDDIKQDRAQMNARLADEQRGDFYSVVVFESGSQREAFYSALGFNVADTYLRGTDLLQRMAQAKGAE